MTIRVGIIGATGYTALETYRLLLRHPEAQVTVATSRSEVGQSIAQIHPVLAGQASLTLTAYDPEAIARECDVAMCCLPHGASAESVRELVNAGVRVIDFSADFRLSDAAIYAHHYGVEHTWSPTPAVILSQRSSRWDRCSSTMRSIRVISSLTRRVALAVRDVR